MKILTIGCVITTIIFLILNVKEEGLETSIIKYLNKYRIENYFFLDQSIPFLIKHSKLCNKQSAARVSEYESIESALRLKILQIGFG